MEVQLINCWESLSNIHEHSSTPPKRLKLRDWAGRLLQMEKRVKQTYIFLLASMFHRYVPSCSLWCCYIAPLTDCYTAKLQPSKWRWSGICGVAHGRHGGVALQENSTFPTFQCLLSVAAGANIFYWQFIAVHSVTPPLSAPQLAPRVIGNEEKRTYWKPNRTDVLCFLRIWCAADFAMVMVWITLFGFWATSATTTRRTTVETHDIVHMDGWIRHSCFESIVVSIAETRIERCFWKQIVYD